MRRLLDTNEARRGDEEESSEEAPLLHKADMSIIPDDEANEIYLKISSLSQCRKSYIKKNWTEEETRLLKWAVITYTKQKSISYNSLVSIKVVIRRKY